MGTVRASGHRFVSHETPLLGSQAGTSKRLADKSAGVQLPSGGSARNRRAPHPRIAVSRHVGLGLFCLYMYSGRMLAMSREQAAEGLKFIEESAKGSDLRIGSKAEDSFREVFRLSFEANVDARGRQLLRAQIVEFSREFVEDLPATKEYKAAVNNFLRSLSFRARQPHPSHFLTLSGVPLALEIHWPFRPIQNEIDYFVHVLCRAGNPWTHEANFTVKAQTMFLDVPTLERPVLEPFVVNGIRIQIDEKKASFYPIGQHPANLQQLYLSSDTYDQRHVSTDAQIQEFIERKVYWFGFRESNDTDQVPVADPYDCDYLRQSCQRLKQVGRVLAANGVVGLDQSGDYASAMDKLLVRSDRYESELQSLLEGAVRPSRTREGRPPTPSGSRGPGVFISYSTDDAPFAASLADALRARDLGVWFDQKEIHIGDSLTERIGTALRANDFIIVVLSPSSVRSAWVQRELGEAMTREIKEKRVVVLPVLARPCRVPAFLTDKKYADFTHNSDLALESLASAIEHHYASYHG